MKVVLLAVQSFRKNIFIYLPGFLAFCFSKCQLGLLISSLNQDKGKTRIISKELMATLPTEKENNIECLEEGWRNVKFYVIL